MAEGQRYYLACEVNKEGTGRLIGIFSNQKNMFDKGLSLFDLSDAYIIGQRKNKPVTAGNISQGLTGRNLTIMRDNEPFIKILVVYMNEANPEIKKENE
jgi:hypothetical protein